MKHFYTYDTGAPIEHLTVLTDQGNAYLYECRTCRAATFYPEEHEQWHEGEGA